MSTLFINRFRKISYSLDHSKALHSLLGIFRSGAIADKTRQLEEIAINKHLSAHHSAWQTMFPPFPACPFARRSVWREAMRGRRDAYLSRLIIETLQNVHIGTNLIVNPVAVFGGHARAIAHSLPTHQVLGTDIVSTWNRIYSIFCRIQLRRHRNYHFVRENIFCPNYERKPITIIFFGACGSLTDACIDYAIAVNSPFLIFHSCCHENIGGNTDLAKYATLLNYGFRMKSFFLNRYKTRGRGFYFSDNYSQDAYPRSIFARGISDSQEFCSIAKHALDSDVCRSIIDLDRCMFLHDHNYDVVYKEEVFFAIERNFRFQTISIS